MKVCRGLLALAGLLVLPACLSAPLQYGARWIGANGVTYVQVTSARNWTDARTACQANNGELVSWGSQSDITASFYAPTFVASDQYTPYYTGLRIRLPPKSAMLKRKPPPPSPKPKRNPSPPSSSRRLLSEEEVSDVSEEVIEAAAAVSPQVVPVVEAALPAAGSEVADGHVAALRRLAQAWGEGAKEQQLLAASALLWSDGSNPAWIRTQLDHMTLRECPQAPDSSVSAECCGYVFNAGPDAYEGGVPLINFAPCKQKQAFVCAKSNTGALKAPPRPMPNGAGRKKPPPPRGAGRKSPPPASKAH